MEKGQAQQLVDALLRPTDNPDFCPVCGKAFALVVGCHKVCRCGYEEGCGD